MSNNVEQIKERLDITDVVGSYVKLEKAGANWKARCPFHNERTPSFFISPVRQSYHCFGCDAGGDMFTFVEEMEGLDFRGALQSLAQLAGVELDSFNPEQQSEKEHLFTLLEKACIWYQRNLTEKKDALAYLYERGLRAETLKEFRIGFAPEEWQALGDYLKKSGFSKEEIEKTGLSAQSERGAFDRFRGRIMFPLADNAGRIVGFSGRIFGEGETKETAKYINSPETALYNKSHILYGFDKAKQDIRKKRTAILVEGQMDLVLSHQEGFSNTIATSGTALSDQHATTISRLADSLILAFDADEAGIRAGLRAASAALARGLDVRLVSMDRDKDPADIIRENPEQWKEMLEQAEHIITARLKHIRETHSDTREFRNIAIKEIAPLITHIESSVDRAHFIQETAKALLLPEDTVREEIERISQELPDENNQSDDTAEASPRKDVAEKRSRKEKTFLYIVALLLWQQSLPESAVDIPSMWKELENAWGGDVEEKLKTIPEEERQKYIFEVEIQYTNPDRISEALSELLEDLKQLRKKEEAAYLLERIRAEEAQGNTEQAEKLLKEYQEITRGLHS